MMYLISHGEALKSTALSNFFAHFRSEFLSDKINLQIQFRLRFLSENQVQNSIEVQVGFQDNQISGSSSQEPYQAFNSIQASNNPPLLPTPNVPQLQAHNAQTQPNTSSFQRNNSQRNSFNRNKFHRYNMGFLPLLSACF